jgi:hypothetical protein
MEDNNLIPEQEHGFIPGRSVVTGLLFSTNTWTKTMDSKQPLDIIQSDQQGLKLLATMTT